MLTINTEQLAQLRAHLEAGYPNEACGIVLGELDLASGQRAVREIVPVANAWISGELAEPAHSLRDRYAIDPEDVARADRRASKLGWDIIGFFHSHPDSVNTPSETDREWAWPVVSFVIATVERGTMTTFGAWLLRDDRSAFDAEEIVLLDS